VDAFPATRHATLRWGGEFEPVRPEVEAALPSALAVHGSGRTPVAGWLFTAAVSILIVMLLWLVVLIYVVMTPATS
jgi:hypothetical protein